MPRLIIGDVAGNPDNDDEPTDRYEITADAIEWLEFVYTRLTGRLRGDD